MGGPPFPLQHQSSLPPLLLPHTSLRGDGSEKSFENGFFQFIRINALCVFLSKKNTFSFFFFLLFFFFFLGKGRGGEGGETPSDEEGVRRGKWGSGEGCLFL